MLVNMTETTVIRKDRNSKKEPPPLCWPIGMPIDCFHDYWFMKKSAHCGCCYPWESSPRLYKKASCLWKANQQTKSSLISALVPASRFLLWFPSMRNCNLWVEINHFSPQLFVVLLPFLPPPPPFFLLSFFWDRISLLFLAFPELNI